MNRKDKKGFKRWVKEHVRPHFRYRRNLGEDFKDEDDIGDRLEKIKDKSEVGIKFRFRF